MSIFKKIVVAYLFISLPSEALASSSINYLKCNASMARIDDDGNRIGSIFPIITYYAFGEGYFAKYDNDKGIVSDNLCPESGVDYSSTKKTVCMVGSNNIYYHWTYEPVNDDPNIYEQDYINIDRFSGKIEVRNRNYSGHGSCKNIEKFPEHKRKHRKF